MKRSKKNKGKEKDLLRSIVEATAPVTGADFFRSLVRQLASALEARYAFVAESLVSGLMSLILKDLKLS